MGQIQEYSPPEIATVLPLRSKYADDLQLDLVKKVGFALENMGFISPTANLFAYTKRIKVQLDEYVNKFPVRKQKGYWIDGGKQLAVFHPDSFLPFVLNDSGSRICRLCNGKHSVREIIVWSIKKHPFQDEIVVKDVMRFLLLLDELDLIEFEE